MDMEYGEMDPMAYGEEMGDEEYGQMLEMEEGMMDE